MKNVIIALSLLTLSLANAEAIVTKSVTLDSGVVATKHKIGNTWTVHKGYAIESYDADGNPVYASSESILHISVKVCSFVDQAQVDSHTYCHMQPAFIITDCATYDGSIAWVEAAVSSAL